MLLTNGAGVAMAAVGSDLRMNDSDKPKEDDARIALTMPNEFTADVTEITVKVECKEARTGEYKLVTEQKYTDFTLKGNHLESGDKDNKLKFSDLNAQAGDRSYVEVDVSNIDLENLGFPKGEVECKITVTIKEDGTTTTKSRELTVDHNGQGNYHD